MYLSKCRADCWSTGVDPLLWIPHHPGSLAAVCPTGRFAEPGGQGCVKESDGSTGGRRASRVGRVVCPCRCSSTQLLPQPLQLGCIPLEARSGDEEWALSTGCLEWLHRSHRIIESLRLGKTSKITKSNCQPNTTTPAKPCPEMPYLHVFWKPPGMVTLPLPWAAC